VSEVAPAPSSRTVAASWPTSTRRSGGSPARS
jgi:hypothetical protein